MTLQELKARREAILAIAGRYGARNLRVFGSVARGEADSASDVDFLVELEPGRSLFDLGGLLMDLQEHLHCKVERHDARHAQAARPRAGSARGDTLVRGTRGCETNSG